MRNDPRRFLLGTLLVGALGCDTETPVEGWQFWDEGPALRGPGYPGTTFAEDELWVACGAVAGGPTDQLHHNLQAPYRGHLLLPWSPELGTGGLSVIDMADPCNPVAVGVTESDAIRETHAIGSVYLPPDDPHAGDWVFTNGKEFGSFLSGVLVWNLDDPAAPVESTLVTIPDALYPDSYTRVVLSLFVQYPWMYVASADNGVYVFDITDPRAPVRVTQVTFGLRAGGVFALGNELLVTSAEQTNAALLDIADPANPVLMPGSPFPTPGRAGLGVETYHGNRVGDWAFFARKEGGGGPIVMSLSDPTEPVFIADVEHAGNGGYVFYDEGTLFVGESDHGSVWDAADPAALTLVGTGDLAGDLDTNVPWGNVMLLSVDEPETDVATAVVPWRAEPDRDGPILLAHDPDDGTRGWLTSARVGLSFNEFIEPASAWPGSVRLLDGEDNPVDGWVSTQETTVSYVPKAPLQAGATYTVEVKGIQDIHGNVMEGTASFQFTTGGG